ncbi:MAG TPA: luciferase family protein [Actinomycetota bacterium]|nr:luciferase family protein [Actinomycetota bacterium]
MDQATEQTSIHDTIRAVVGGWPGVEAVEHRFGGTEFRMGKVEIGHIHGNRLADLPFPRRIRNEIIEAGRALPHHVLPDSGWVSRWISGPDEVDDVIALFRLNYERYAKRS